MFGLEESQNGISPVSEDKAVKEYPRDPYKEIDENENWSDELKAQKKAEIDRSIKKYKDKEKEINREHIWEQTKNYGGAALEIGSAFVPGLGGAKLLGAITKKLVPKVGKKLAQELATGTLKGISSSAVEGFGRGLMEDENPLATAAQDAITGAVLGGAGGAVGGNVEKAIRGNKLRKIDNLKTLRKKETDYYKNYIQGTKTKHSVLGDINFTQTGLETVSKHPQAGRSFNSLKNDLSRAEYIGYELPYHKKHGQKDNIKGFHKLKKDNKEFLIADTSDGYKYYMSKQVDDTGIRPSRVEPVPSNNIISSSNTNLNPQASNQTIQPPKTHNQWLEDLKRKRKKRWF